MLITYRKLNTYDKDLYVISKQLSGSVYEYQGTFFKLALVGRNIRSIYNNNICNYKTAVLSL